jgi:hypothetical protein
MSIAVRQAAAARLIDAWEAAQSQHRIDRALTLAGCFTDLNRAELASLSLGELDAILVDIRRRVAGDLASGVAACESCGEPNEFTLNLATLPRPTPPPEGLIALVAKDRTIRARRATSYDLAAAAGEPDEDQAVRLIARRCLIDDDDVGDEVLGAFERDMEAREGPAALELSFVCCACGAAGRAPFDVFAFLWAEISRRAQALIEEVETLAFAYGWSEMDILAMPDRRRALYAERARR